MILYGRNPVREALRGRRARAVRDIWATRAPRASRGSRVSLCARPRRRRSSAAAARLPTRAFARRRAPTPTRARAELLALEQPLLVALDQVQDPQNLGSICRTAECAGAAGVVIPERRAAEVTPAVCKASAGAVEHLRVARVRNLADFLAEAKRAGCWCYGASAPGARGRAAPVPYDAPDYGGAGVVLVLGSEGSGLRPRVASACDELIALPLLGRVESLGVSAAAAALLYEILQSRCAALTRLHNCVRLAPYNAEPKVEKPWDNSFGARGGVRH